jgi:hypothetical protein
MIVLSKISKHLKTKRVKLMPLKNFINELFGPKNGVLGEAGINKLFADKYYARRKIKPKRIAIQIYFKYSKSRP